MTFAHRVLPGTFVRVVLRIACKPVIPGQRAGLMLRAIVVGAVQHRRLERVPSVRYDASGHCCARGHRDLGSWEGTRARGHSSGQGQISRGL